MLGGGVVCSLSGGELVARVEVGFVGGGLFCLVFEFVRGGGLAVEDGGSLRLLGA